jgi:hypothetical protein
MQESSPAPSVSRPAPAPGVGAPVAAGERIPPHGERPGRALSARVLLLALILIPLNCYWIIQMERVRSGPYVTSISLFANVIFILLLFTALNAGLHRWWPRAALRRGELLLIYVMLSISTGICGMDMVQVLMQIIAFPFYFASDSNRWADELFPILPTWLTVRDTSAIVPFFRGQSTLYTPAHLAAWLVPTLAWTAFGTALILVMMCVNVLFRRQWVDRERLTFPVIHLPLEMIDSPGPFFRNRLMWGGFTLAASLSVLNGLNYLFPAVPAIQVTQFDLAPFITTKPWSAVGWTPISFYPFAIGLGFLLPVDLLFSCWFFYLYWKLQLVISNAMGWDVTPKFPYQSEQVFGAIVAIGLSLLWASRNYMREVWREATGAGRWASGVGGSTVGPNAQRPTTNAAPEALSPRAALLGAAGGTLFLLGFSVLAGMSLLWAVTFFAIYLLIVLVITRIRAELGPPVHDFHFIGPDYILIEAFGSRTFGRGDLAMIGLFWWFNRAYRGHPMPHGLEGLKMADRTRTARRDMFIAAVLAGALGMFASMWAFTHLGYELGTAAKFRSGHGYGWDVYNRMDQWVTAPAREVGGAVAGMGAGAAGALLLIALRSAFFGWPLHPIGYAISGSWSMNLVWLPLLIAWGAKLLVLRYGGLRLYRTALPFFLGLILGDATMGTLWSVIGLLLGTPTYNFWGG